ncbi:extracellular solute-binding protein [Paenibacillus hamazuiensis]|uniref:extracellular solute-binding protein n=1 Tax=Paenibacillus hamazuiensis TaxID=2936508 RepID=UPI00200C4E21
MKKKFVTLLLCAALPGSLLAACGSNEPKPAAGGEAAPPTVKLALSTRNFPYIEASPNINEDKYVNKLRELSKTNVRLELIPQKEYSQKLNLMFAAGELPDAIQVVNGITSPEVAPALSNNAFYDLNELIDKYAPSLKTKIGKELWNSALVSKDGKIYAIPAERATRNNQIVYIRKDWLDKLGLQVPKTVDEYLNVLRAFRDKDPNGNGKADEIPFSGRMNFNYAEIFFSAYDVSLSGWKYENNQLVPNFIRPQMKEALKLHQSMYQEKLMDNEIFLNQPKDFDSKVKATARVGMWVHVPDYPDKWAAEVKSGDPKAVIMNIPAPIGPDGKGGSLIGSAVNPLSAWVIPRSNKHPENVLKFLEWYYSDAAQKFLNYGLEGDDYTTESGKLVYKQPQVQADIDRETMHLHFLRFIGPTHLTDKDYINGRVNGDLITKALQVANSEGRVNDALDMPIPPTLQSKPELGYTGLWIETAAKIITGKESIDSFDKFVDDWKKRGGDKVIQEATDWYKKQGGGK